LIVKAEARPISGIFAAVKAGLAAIKDLLDKEVYHYNQRSFIDNDPLSIPHLFSKKEDREIAGFLAATIAWGNRKSILKNARQLVRLMDDAPHQFILEHQASDRKRFEGFVHRTFNGKDCRFFIAGLQNIYLNHGGLEKSFSPDIPQANLRDRIVHFRKIFLKTRHEPRSEKHISDPSRKSSAKRICMFLRWMVRNDRKGVDFGLWRNISPADLCLPLDVHTGNVSRQLGLLRRKQNDWQAVEEITAVLKTFDPHDPIKYDFALFGMGVDKKL
jgi:uncharacterized protein (TIGR02757 family)